MPDYREEMLIKIMNGLYSEGIECLEQIKPIIIRCIGNYEVTERCTEIAVVDNLNEKYLELFFADKRTNGGSEHTEEARRYIIKRFMADVNKDFIKINKFDIMLWLSQQQKTVSLSTAKNYQSILKSLFTWLAVNKIIPLNPMEDYTPIKCPEPIKKPFTSVEVDALKTHCRSLRERSMVELLLSSGIRCDEMCHLKWDNINFQTNEVTVIKGKGNKNRVTMMDDITKKYLQMYRKSMKHESEYVFATYYRGKVRIRDTDSVRDAFNRLGERAGVSETNPHKFRRTFATVQYRKGMDIHMIQRLLGHSSITTTMRYINDDSVSLQNEYRKYNF